jgi:hypothetical protein
MPQRPWEFPLPSSKLTVPDATGAFDLDASEKARIAEWSCDCHIEPRCEDRSEGGRSRLGNGALGVYVS